MTILGLSGAIGSGKSHTQMKVALDYCERKRRQLVCNFPVNTKALYDYCKLKNYSWCKFMILKGGVVQIVNPNHLEALLIPESVVCLDEAGIFLNSREFATTSKRLLADLAQSRKQGTDLIWAAQFNEQVDRQLRLLTQYWVHCDSISTYSRELRRPKLFWKRIYWMTAWEYNNWVENPKVRSSHFRTRYAFSFQYEGGLLSEADRVLFGAFDSFNRLDDEAQFTHIHTLQRYDFTPQQLAEFRNRANPELLQRWENRQSKQPAKPVETEPVSSGRGSLVGQALQLSRTLKLPPPYFKKMNPAQIQAWINEHS